MAEINITSKKRVFYVIYVSVAIYVTVMYLLRAYRGDQRSYSVMINLSLAFGILSGIVFVEAEKNRRWFLPVFLSALWISGVVVDFVRSTNSGTWGRNGIYRHIFCFLDFFVPLFVIWLLSKIKKGGDVIQTFVGAVLSLFSLGFLPGRGKIEPLYDILLVALPIITFAMIAQNQSQRQRWLSLLVFLAVYSFPIIANPYVNLIMFVLVAIVLIMVQWILSATWSNHTKKTVIIVSTCLMSAISTIAIPVWSSYALQRFVYSKHTIPVGNKMELENAFVTPENDTITLESLRGKTVVFYFWSASCGTCHAMMPEYSAFAESYADSSDKIFYAVFLSKNENDLKHYEKIMNHEYTFQWIMALNVEEVMRKLEFNTFPHLTIISPDGTITYNGLADFQRKNIRHPRRYLNS